MSRPTLVSFGSLDSSTGEPRVQYVKPQNWQRLNPLSSSFPFWAMKTYVGIDVAKDTLAVALPQTATSWKVRSIRNTPEAIRKMINELPDSAHVLLEATGSYFVLLTYLLCQAQVTVSVINPKQSHHFAQLQLEVTKMDESDAVLLARYGQLVQPPCYTIESDVICGLSKSAPCYATSKNSSVR